MKTVNSVSGGKSSAYIAANYPADYNVFCLVRSDDNSLLWQKGKDEKTRQLVSDKLGIEFIGTLEDDMIIYTMLDLEQYLGSEIIWLTGRSFDQIISRKANERGGAYNILPNKTKRFCTYEMKILPIYRWARKNKLGVYESRIGFRAGEENRAKKHVDRLVDGIMLHGKVKSHIPTFPLINDNIRKADVVNFWKDNAVRFAEKNNCVGCFHRNPAFLNLIAQKHPEKMEWFASKEMKRDNMRSDVRWIDGTTYRKIIDAKFTIPLNFEDFGDCDSGSCGL